MPFSLKRLFGFPDRRVSAPRVPSYDDMQFAAGRAMELAYPKGSIIPWLGMECHVVATNGYLPCWPTAGLRGQDPSIECEYVDVRGVINRIEFGQFHPAVSKKVREVLQARPPVS